jgi:Zn-dependent M28 family amino/carboxypeptidase
MIGDRNLEILKEGNSSADLTRIVWKVAADIGYGSHFPNRQIMIEDDHAPFLSIGVPALDLIDFSYGPEQTWWHTEKDTLDKLSSESFQIVGDVLLETLRRIEAY